MTNTGAIHVTHLPPYMPADTSEDNIADATLFIYAFGLALLLWSTDYKEEEEFRIQPGVAHGLGMTLSLALQFEIVEIIKQVVGALRPDPSLGHDSFPSEHTAMATCVCNYLLLGVMQYQHKSIAINFAALIIGIAYPCWVASQRMVSNHHHAADVVG